MFTVVCAWCGKVIKEALHQDAEADPLVSHGLCPECRRVHFSKK
jgi:phage FluMu protein Com